MANYDSGYEEGMAFFDEGRPPGTYDFSWGEGKDEGQEPYFGLPHQCSDWKIGNADQVRLMIADLQALITEEE
jgi:hypothetical protein